MTAREFEEFVEHHPQVEYAWVRLGEDEQTLDPCEPEQASGLAFRVPGMPWYEKPGNVSFLAREKTANITPAGLWDQLTRGLDVEHMTRITGYYSKTQQWNPGKRAELRDRFKGGLQSGDPLRLDLMQPKPPRREQDQAAGEAPS